MSEQEIQQFSREDEQALAAIDLAQFKGKLPADQFTALSKLLGCFQALSHLNAPGTAQ